MQVMGIIPKKERKKKIEPSYLPDGSSVSHYDTFKLPNGYCSDEKSNSHKFSASKMFPELAGKLSLDNQKPCDTANKASSKAATTSNNLASKRSRKPTRKYLSMLKKKQLGLFTEEEAKASLTTAGSKAYNYYANSKLNNSDLLTPLMESSDDDSFTSSLITHGVGVNSPLSCTTGLSGDLSE